MLRRLVLVLLFVSALWQGVAVAGQAIAFGHAEETAHALLHWQETAHHHLDDGSVAVDDSDESVRHVVADACLGATAVWSTAPLTVAPAQAERPAVSAGHTKPGPHPDGPRRPPRLTA
jgi:hypothetical protein